MTTPRIPRRSDIARILTTIAVGTVAVATTGCTTAPWAYTQPKTPAMVLHPDQGRVANGPTFASAPDVN